MRSLLGYISPYVRSLEKERDQLLQLSFELLGVKLKPEEKQSAGLLQSLYSKVAKGKGGAKATEPVQVRPMTMPQALEALQNKSYEEHYGKEAKASKA